MSAGEGRDWSDYEMHVISELERLSEGLVAVLEEVKKISDIKTDIEVLKAKAGLWGAISGAVTALSVYFTQNLNR